MQPLLRSFLKFLNAKHTRTSKHSEKGRKDQWAGNSLEGGARGFHPNGAPGGFHRLEDSDQRPILTSPSSVSNAIYVGARKSTTTTQSFLEHDNGGVGQDAIPLNAIRVKKDVSISGAQKV